MIISGDSTTLYTCSMDRTIRIWNIKTAEEIGRFEGHTNIINHMIIDENRKMLYGYSNDGTIKAWYLKNDERILNSKFKGH